jgi:VWFA-related protein
MRIRAGICAALFAVLVSGQQTTIRTSVPLVVLPTSVTDEKGHFIAGLSSSDFLVLDEGRNQPVKVDESDVQFAPIALVAVIQISDISASALGKIEKVGSMIPEAVVGANGEAAVVTFDDEVRVKQDFTRDPDAIFEAFQDLKAANTGEGRMLDAVEQSLEMLGQRPGPRRSLIVLISESKDRGSKSKLPDVVKKIQLTGVTLYSLTYSAYLTPFTTKASEYSPPLVPQSNIVELFRLAKKNTVEALVGATGGQELKFETKSKLENDLIRLGTDIHSRYVLSFTPDVTGPRGYHRLDVRIKDRPHAVVCTRPGYWNGLDSEK